VGVGNHKLFLLFVFYVFLTCSYALLLTSSQYLACILRENCASLNAGKQLMIIFLVIESILFGLFTLCMMGDQMTVITTNQTQIDRLKNKKYAYQTEINEVFGSDIQIRCAWSWLYPYPVKFPVHIRDIILGFRPLHEIEEDEQEDSSSSSGNNNNNNHNNHHHSNGTTSTNMGTNIVITSRNEEEEDMEDIHGLEMQYISETNPLLMNKETSSSSSIMSNTIGVDNMSMNPPLTISSLERHNNPIGSTENSSSININRNITSTIPAITTNNTTAGGAALRKRKVSDFFSNLSHISSSFLISFISTVYTIRHLEIPLLMKLVMVLKILMI
jgi:hypothetical protein